MSDQPYAERSRSARMGVAYGPAYLGLFRNEDSPWFESDDEIEVAVTSAEERTRLLAWIRRTTERRLTRSEREAIELHYLAGYNYREAAMAQGTNPAAVHRAVRRGIRKLQAAAKKDGIGYGRRSSRL